MRDRGPWFVADGPHRMVRTRLTSAAVAIGFAFLAGGCASSRRPPRVEAPPMPLRMGAVEEGLASWYGEPYHGRPTASGPRYDMWAMTAAHRTLPLRSQTYGYPPVTLSSNQYEDLPEGEGKAPHPGPEDQYPRP